MKFLIQIVDHASVEILDTNTTNSIGKWLLIYVGIGKEDIANYAEKLEKFAYKVGTTKFFHNIQTHKIDQSLTDINGEILLISNFTLYGDNKKWTKLDFSDSAGFVEAKNIYEELVKKLETEKYTIKTWEFWAMMKVSLVNDGPINVVWEY